MKNLMFHEDDDDEQLDMIPLEERLTLSEDGEIRDLSPKEAKEIGLRFDEYEEQSLVFK